MILNNVFIYIISNVCSVIKQILCVIFSLLKLCVAAGRQLDVGEDLDYLIRRFKGQP